MHLVFDIFQGIGVAAAVGIRPFLPALVVGALGAAHAQINFDAAKGNDFAFLQHPPFLITVTVIAIITALVDRQTGGPTRYAIFYDGAAAAILGAMFFAGSLCRGGYAIWPGIVGGVICALIGLAASQPLFTRVRARLDKAAAAAVPLYAEFAGVAAAALSVLAPPVGVIVLLALLALLWTGRGRGEQKYAGLRILR